MWSGLRGRVLCNSSLARQWKNSALFFSLTHRNFSSSNLIPSEINNIQNNKELLSLSEVQKILKDVGADDVSVIPAPRRFEVTDYMVVATGRSPWHVRNIATALIYQIKQKQAGAKRMLLPSVVGQEGGKWIVIDSGNLIIHAVDEKARAYYNFEGLWTSDTSNSEQSQDLEKAFVKIRRKNNSKKHPQAHTQLSL